MAVSCELETGSQHVYVWLKKPPHTNGLVGWVSASTYAWDSKGELVNLQSRMPGTVLVPDSESPEHSCVQKSALRCSILSLGSPPKRHLK